MDNNFKFNITLTREQLEFVRTGLKEIGFNVIGDKGETAYRGVTFEYVYTPFAGDVISQTVIGTLTLTIESKSILARLLSDDYIESEVRGMVATYLASMPIRKPGDPPAPPTGGPAGEKAA